MDTETGELRERRLQHREEAKKFYCDLAAQGVKVRVGMGGRVAQANPALRGAPLKLRLGGAFDLRSRRDSRKITPSFFHNSYVTSNLAPGVPIAQS